MLVVAVLAAQPAFARNTVSGLRLGAHPDGITRFVMDLGDNMDFSVMTATSPNRVVVSTPGLAWSVPQHRPTGAVRAVRYEDIGGQGRILVDLKDPALVKSAFVMAPRDGLGWRFVMDLQQTNQASFASSANAFRPLPKIEGARISEPAPAPEGVPQARAIVVYSPEVRPPAAPAAPAPTPVQPAVTSEPLPVAKVQAVPLPVPKPELKAEPKPEPKPQPVAAQPIAPPPSKAAKANGPMLSAPVPPPLDRPAGEPSPVKQAAMQAPPQPQPQPQPSMSEPEPRSRPTNATPVVVIDPGHGGVDPGATGVSGIYEKYITMAVARELKATLEKGGRYKVHLTRDRDVFIRLRDRIAIARQLGADLFISLHADSVANPALKGLSVYTLSQTASDTEAQALADKENKADLIAGIDLSHESADVANILIDLAQRETMNRSAVFAGGVVDEVGRETVLLGNTHRFAGFAVLKAPDVPSVLVELGYLSNEAEERNLRQPEYRSKLTRAVARSIDRFFLQGQKAKR
ncbi:putative N-acetylmuramoyl-L-alanine amidase [Magnetospirillum sp. LM-5]|nr:putative N-acetylmuramoyl-L-alanine amidase [Magnetospirillum sp. LM-5]